MKYYNLIEKFLDGKLNKKEINNFREMLVINEELKKALNLVTEVDQYLGDLDEANFRNELEKIIRKESRTNKIFFRKFLLSPLTKYAASIILLIAVAIFLNNYIIPDKSTRLYNKFYQPYEYSIVARSKENSDLNKEFINALKEYNSGNYKNAVHYFDQVLKKDSQYIIAGLLIAICYIEQEETTRAKTMLSEIISIDNYLLNETASWYLAMCFIKENDFSNAVIVLKELTSYNNYYQTNAQRLLNRIN